MFSLLITSIQNQKPMPEIFVSFVYGKIQSWFIDKSKNYLIPIAIDRENISVLIYP